MADPTFDRLSPLPTEQSEPISADTRSFISQWWSWFKMVDNVVRQAVQQFPGEIVSETENVVFLEGKDILYPENRDYPILSNAPYPGSITGSYSKSFAGTGTATFKKNGTSIGGTANSISTTAQTQSHALNWDVGDNLSVTVSSASGDLELAELHLITTRPFDWLKYSGG